MSDNEDVFKQIASYEEGQWSYGVTGTEVPGGCLVKVTTAIGGSMSEAMSFVPNVELEDGLTGRKLVLSRN